MGWAAVAVLCVLLGARMLGSSGGRDAAPIRVEGSAGARDGPRRSGRLLYVHVAGAVRRPGLVRVPAGARVAEALERVGGPTRRAELAGVNLAAPLEDGQQVVVPRGGAAGGAAPGSAAGARAGAPAEAAVSPGSAAAPGSKLSLASATLDQLDALEGIGPTLARRILEFRASNGGFRSVEQLREVDGIGEKRYEALREAVAP